MKDLVWVERGKDAVRARLKDPDSAKFRDAFVSRSGGPPVACGYVNAKNSFGGYGGFQRFVFGGPNLTFLESDVADDFEPVWRKLCQRSK